MPKVKFELEADDARAVQAFLNVHRAQGKTIEGMSRLGRSTRTAMAEAEKSVDALRRKLRETEEAAATSAARSTVARVRNLTQGAADLSLSQTTRQMLRQGGSGAYIMAAQDIQFARWQAAQRVRDDRAFRRFLAADGGATSTLAAGEVIARGVGKDLKGAANEMHAAAASARMRMLAALGSVTAVLAALGRVQGEVEADRRSAIDRKIASRVEVSKLRQLASSQADLDLLLSETTKYRTTLGLNEQEAAAVVFNLRSTGQLTPGIDRQLQQLQRLGVAPTEALTGHAVIRSIYGEVGNIGQNVSKVLAAAGPARADVNELIAGIGQSGILWRNVGGNEAEQLALLAAFGEGKNVAFGSERLASLAAQLDKRRGRIRLARGEQLPSGLALLDYLPTLEKQGRLLSSSGERQTIGEFLEEQNAKVGYGLYVTNRDLIRRQAALIAAEGRKVKDTLVSVRSSLKIEATDAAQKLVGTTQQVEVASEQTSSEISSLRDIVQNRMIADAAKKGEYRKWATDWLFRAQNFATFDVADSRAFAPEIAGYYLSEEEQRRVHRVRAAGMDFGQLSRKQAEALSAGFFGPAGEREFRRREAEELAREMYRRRAPDLSAAGARATTGDVAGAFAQLREVTRDLASAATALKAAVAKPPVTIPPAANPNRGL